MWRATSPSKAGRPPNNQGRRTVLGVTPVGACRRGWDPFTYPEIRKFLDEAPAIQNVDNQVDAARLAAAGGRGVRQAAAKAMTGTPEELDEFLLYGFEGPLDIDRQAEIARISGMGGCEVKAEVTAALKGTVADREEFLAKGQYEARKLDNQAEVAGLASAGGPNMRAAATVALKGTPEDIVEFLEIGQFTARDRDQELMSVADLVKQAEQAGRQAEDAAEEAEEAKDKAVESSRLAKEAARNAAEELAGANISKKEPTEEHRSGC